MAVFTLEEDQMTDNVVERASRLKTDKSPRENGRDTILDVTFVCRVLCRVFEG